MTRPLSFRVAERAPEPEFVPHRHYGLAIAGAVIASLILWCVAIWLVSLAAQAVKAVLS